MILQDISLDNTQQVLKLKLAEIKNRSSYSELAELITSSLKQNSSQINRRVFGYIPQLFREISINNWHQGVINSSNLPVGEPVIYKINFPQQETMRKIPFFYLFCYIKDRSKDLNVYFQSATIASNPYKQSEYSISSRKIAFEGLISAFSESESAICISDPGHFIPGLKSSFYVGTKKINFASLIANVIEDICSAAQIKLENTLLFGSSAGGMGALLSSTYFSDKVQVLSVNTQIYTHGMAKVMRVLLGTQERKILVKKFGDRISCMQRFSKQLNQVPNIYLLVNVNDNLYQRNYKFFQRYQKLYTGKNRANQSIFDSYFGLPGHGRPDKVSLKKKIAIARASLTMKANFSPNQSTVSQSAAKSLKFSSQVKQASNQLVKSHLVVNKIDDSMDFTSFKQGSFNQPTNTELDKSFDAYISLGDNCEAGIQFVRIGYKESSLFRFTSSKLNTTLKIIKNDFSDIFNRKYIVPRPGCPKMVFNNKYKIAFHSKLTSIIDSQGNQDFDSAYDFERVFQDETNKINYLISKWYKLMESDSKVLFFLKNDSCENYIDEATANRLCKLLLNKYKNHNFKILCLQLDKFAEPQWKNRYLINRYFPYFAPRTSAMHGNSPESSWDRIFAEFPLRAQN